jgi:hypothetical protein
MQIIISKIILILLYWYFENFNFCLHYNVYTDIGCNISINKRDINSKKRKFYALIKDKLFFDKNDNENVKIYDFLMNF